MQHSIDIDIEWGDCDPARIVFYPNFFAWFDKGTTHLFRAAGLDWPTLFEEFGVVGLPIVDAQAEFLGPCRFGETVTVTSTIGELRKKSLVVAHEVTIGGNLVVNGREIRAWTERHPDDPARLRAVPIPDVMRERLA